MNKYRNKKTEYNGMTFDSNRELYWWKVFEEMEANGEIHNLRRQVKYNLIPSFTDEDGKQYRECNYIADIVWDDLTGKTHVADVKGMVLPEFKLKQKMFAYQYGFSIEILK